MAAVEAGIKTFLIADVRGYTRFTQERGDEAAARLATRFAELAREASRRAAGRSSSSAATRRSRCSTRRGRRSAPRSSSSSGSSTETVADPSLPLAVGIGLDAGEAVPVEGGYRGGALNLAARLCSLAGAGRDPREPGVVAPRAQGRRRRRTSIAGRCRSRGSTKPVQVVASAPRARTRRSDLAFRRALDPAARPADARRRATRTRACARSRRPTRRTSSAGRR